MRVGLGLLALLAAGCHRDAEPRPVWLGHLAPLGEEGGEQAVRAMQLELGRWKEEGFSAGGRSVAVRHADSGKGQARAEATRLLAANRVAALIVGPGVGEVEDVVALARAHEAPVVVLDEIADEATAGPAILLGPSPRERGRALAEYALTIGKDKEQRRVLLVRDDKDRVTAAAAAAFAETWRAAGGTITRAEKDTINAVVLAVPPARFATWADSAREVNVPVLYAGPDGGLPSTGRLTVVEATAFVGVEELPEEGRAWAKRFQERFRQPPGRSAMLAHEGLGLVLSGLREVGGDAPAKLRRDLAARDSFEGLAGTLRWKDGRPRRPLYLVRHAGGERQVVKTIPAAER